MPSENWPALPLRVWRDTYATLHMWMQIVGKVRMALTPPVNHWWHVPLYVTSRGLTTSPIPYEDGTFEVEFDFIDHALRIGCNDGRSDGLELAPRPVADFYTEFLSALESLGISLEAIASSTRIGRPLLADLERGDLSKWPGGIYRRSFVRDYAAAIELSPEEVLAELLELFPEEGAPAVARPPASRPGSALRLTFVEDRTEAA